MTTDPTPKKMPNVTETAKIKQVGRDFARGDRSEPTLRAVFEEHSLEDFRRVLPASSGEDKTGELGEFIEALRKEYVFQITDLDLYGSDGEKTADRSGVSSWDGGLDIVAADKEKKVFCAESDKIMRPGSNGKPLGPGDHEAYRAAKRGETFLRKKIGDPEKYTIKVNVATCNGLSERARKNLKETEITEYETEVLEWEDLQQQYHQLQNHFSFNGFDTSEEKRNRPATPCDHQLDFIEKSKSGPKTGGFDSGSILSKNFRVLLYHDCRTGKTYASLLALDHYIDKRGYPNILIAGPPSLFRQWRDSIREIHGGDENIIQIGGSDQEFESGVTQVDGHESFESEIEEDKINFILCSFQMMKVGDADKRALKDLRNVSLDFFFVDESHDEFRTEETRKEIRKLNQGEGVGIYNKSADCRVIALSATPLRRFLVEHFEQGNMHVFDHYEKEAKILSDEPAHPFIQNQPLLNHKILSINQNGVSDFYDRDSGLNLRLLADDPNRRETLMNVLYRDVYNTIHEGRRGEKVRMRDGIWRVDEQSIARKMCESAKDKKSPLGQIANIEYVVSDEYSAGKARQKAQALFNRIDKRHNILIVVGQLTQGHTFPTVNHTVDLTELKSQIERFQFMKRAGNPYFYDDGTRKRNYFSFDFSIYRTLRTVYDAIEAHRVRNPDSDLNHDDKVGMTSIIAPINDPDKYGFEEWSDEQIKEHFSSVPSIAESMSSQLYVAPLIVGDDADFFNGVDHECKDDPVVMEHDKGTATGGDGDLDQAKRNQSGDGGGNNEDSDPNVEIMKTVQSNIRMLVLCAYFDNEVEMAYDYPSLIRNLGDTYVEEILGSLQDPFSEVGLELDAETVARGLSEIIDDEDDFQKQGIELQERNIEEYSGKIDQLLQDWSFANTYTQGSFSDIATPESIVREMNDQFPDEFWKDKTNTYVDPCCGTGTFLKDAYERFFIGLRNVIKDPEKRKQHIIEKQLYGADRQHKNKMLTTTRLCGDDEYDHNIEQVESSLEKNWNMKFDAVVTNPPYQKNTAGYGSQASPIYHKFVDLGYGISSRYVLMITKSRWFGKKRYGMKNFREEMTERNVEVIKHWIVEEQPFDQEIKGGVSYFLIDKGEDTKKTNFNGVEIDLGKFGFITQFPEYADIMDHVFNEHSGKYLSEITESRSSTGLNTNDDRLHENRSNGDVKCYVSERRGSVKFVDPEEDEGGLGYHKVITQADPSKLRGWGDMITSGPDETFSFTYLAFKTETEEQAENLAKYLQLDVPRFMLMMRRNSQHLSDKVLKYIPILDLDTEWTNDEVYEEFGLTDQKKEIQSALENTPKT